MMTIEDCREFYAREVKFAASLTTPGLVEAFAKVPREKFLGPEVNATIGQGVMTKITQSNGKYATELVSPVGIYSGGSLSDASLELQMLKGLTTGGLLKLRSVRRDAHEPGETCVVHGQEVCLSLAEAK